MIFIQPSTLYVFAKDFAGPMATALAAGGAFYLGWRFGRVQANAVSAQAEIALDKLKYDLFEKRYEIYSAAKVLIEKVIHVRSLDKSDPEEIRKLYIKLDESRFFFPSDIQKYLKDIEQTSEKLLTLVGGREVLKLNEAQWATAADEIGAISLVLQNFYIGLPEKFEQSLAFRQVTKS